MTKDWAFSLVLAQESPPHTETVNQLRLKDVLPDDTFCAMTFGRRRQRLGVIKASLSSSEVETVQMTYMQTMS